MDQFFAATPTLPAFQLFGPAHIAALAALVLLNLLLLRFRGADEETRRKVRWTLAIALWANEVAWHVWNYSIGQWNIQTMLPLHICSVFVWIGAWMLVTKNYHIYEFVYFLGIGGATQALATPDLGIYGYPHFRFFQTFISHGLIVTAAVYMTTVEGFRPTWKSLGRVALWANVYMVIIYFVNSAIGSNYMMINAKPATASVLDLLPPWPIYVLYMEAMGLIVFLLLYLPFIFKDRRAAASAPA